MSITALITRISGRVAGYRMGKAREAAMVRETERLLAQLASPRRTTEQVARMHCMEALAVRALETARKFRAMGEPMMAAKCQRHAATVIAAAYGC